MMKTYDSIINQCRDIFYKKYDDYGSAWRVMRLSSLTDQIMIKIRRIQVLKNLDEQKIPDSIEIDLMGVINYSVIALIQMNCNETTPILLTKEEAMRMYDLAIDQTQNLYIRKNHDYGDSWKLLRQSSIIDLILMKVFRLINIEKNSGRILSSDNIDTIYKDIINYSIFYFLLGDNNN